MVSLANEIIYGTTDSVTGLLEAGTDPNEYDEYGFTPLIESVIADRFKIAEILLAHDADPNQADFAGRTPLHWAAESHNLKLCQLLLEHKADPNAYTYSAEPVLAIPYLRAQQRLKSLLYKHGAQLSFAKDYVNGKLLGHRYELRGHTYIVNTKNEFVLLDLEGFFLEFSLRTIKESVKRYKINFSAKHLKDYFDKIEIIIKSLTVASELVRYQQYTVDLRKQENRINQLLQAPLLLIPATYRGHAITFIKLGNLFAKCDRGVNSKFEGSVVIYKITKPKKSTTKLFKKILYQKQSDEFMHLGINKFLGLERILNLPIGPQITGNCSWANVEAAIPTMLFFLLATEQTEKTNIGLCAKKALTFYEEWREWDKDRALDECIQSFDDSKEMRNASKAILLATILFQTCNYEDIRNIARAEKILSILKDEEFKDYLETYVRIYYKDKWSEAGENLMHLFDIVSPEKKS